MKRKRVVAALLVVVLAGQLALPANAQSSPAVMSAAELTTMFTDYGNAGGHWTGGDGTASVALPDGRVVWLFADSFLGTVNADHSRPANSPLVNNLMVVQDGTTLTSTLHGGTPEAPAALVKPQEEGEFYWVADGVVEGNTLKVIYNRIRSTGGGALDFYQTGVALATFTLPDLTLASVVELPLGPKIGWGGGIFPDGAYTYIYGISSAPGRMKFAHLARVPTGGLSGPWEFWTGSAWSPHVEDVGRLISGVGAGGVQKVGSQYVWVTHENNLVFDPQIVAYTSSSPTGPFTGPIPLFTAPEPQTNGLIIYDVRVHPELARSGKLLASYNVNSLNPGGTIADVRHGRPRFIEVDWPRPATPGVPVAPGTPTLSGHDTVATVSWPAVSGATSYRVYQKDVTGGQTHFARLPNVATGTSAQAGFLVPGHTYEYKVTAVNAAGEGPFSPVSTVTPRSTKPVTEAVRGSRSSRAIAGSYIVELTDATPTHSVADYARALVAQTGGTLIGVVTHAFSGFGATLTEAQAIDLASHPDVQAVEQELLYTLDDGGTQEPAPWHLDRIDQRDLPLDEKYVFPNAGSDVRAYVVDSGIRHDNEFVDRVVSGHNALDGSTDTEDCTRGHGTMVAGVLGAFTYGVAKDVQIVPVKVTSCDGAGNPVVGSFGIHRGLNWVIGDSIDKRPAVVNLSLGIPYGEQGSGFVEKATRKALNSGLTVVNSAGNNGGDACAYSPKRITRDSALISVGATDGLDRRWNDSNQGPCVDLFAPGAGIITTGPSDTQVVAIGEGTSMAAPAVTGAAAILLTEHPEYSPEEVKRALLASATPGKVTNIGATTPNRLLYIGPAPTHAPENLTATPDEDGTIDLDWDPVPETGVHYLVYSRNVTLGEPELKEWDDPVFDGTSAVFRDGQEGHTYEFRVAAANTAGTSPQSAPAQATVDQAPPGPATNLTAASQADGTIRLAWTSSAPGLWHYVYLRDLDADPPQEQPSRLEWPVSEGNSTTLGWLTNGHEYEMYVTAIGPGGESVPSNLARATATFPLPPAPSNLAAASGDRTVTLTWESAGDGVWYWIEMRNVTAGESAFTRLGLPVSTCCTFVSGDLTNGSAYDFRVVAIGADGGPDSAPSNTVRATPAARPPDPPTGLVATPGNAQAELTWTESTQPDAWYWIEMRPAGGAWQRLGLPITTCCSFVSTGLTNGTTYEYRVVTIGANGGPDSAPSNVASARPVAPPAGAPSNLRATAGNARVDLTWTASSSPGAWYWVEMRNVSTGQSWQRLSLPITTCCSFASSGLTNGNTYEYRVVTIGANGAPDSAPSNVASARPVAPRPGPPSNLRATAGNARVDLTWTASPTAGSWYWIEMRNASSGQSWQRISAPVTTCCSFASTGLSNGDIYEYRVRAIGGGGAPDSAPSNVASARPVAPQPGPPSNLTATAGDGKVTLRWTASSTPGAWYWIWYRNATRRQAWQKLNTPVTTCCTFVSAYLNNGETYEYRVSAIGGGGAPDSPFSNTVSARPMPPTPQPPTNLRASPGDNEAYLSWNASPTPGVGYYMYYRVHYASGYGAWTRTVYPALTTTMTAGYLRYGWTYEFKIVASNLSGESAPSNVVSVLIVPYNQRRKCASVTSNWALGGNDAVQLYDITTSMCAERSNFTFKLEASWSSQKRVRDAVWFWRLVDCYTGKEIARYGIGYPAPGTDLRSQSEVTYFGLKPGNLYRFTLEGWGKLTGHIGEETRFSPYPDGHVGIIPHMAATSCF